MDIDIRIYKTKQNIKQALFELLREKSFDKITTQNIVDKALTGRSTFYNHFLDKYDLLEQIVEQHTRTIREQIERRYRTTDPQEIKELIDEIVSGVALHKEEIGTLLLVHLPKADLRKNIEDILYEANLEYLTSTMKNATVPLDYLARLYASSVFTLITWTIENGKNEKTVEAANKMQKLIFGNIPLS